MDFFLFFDLFAFFITFFLSVTKACLSQMAEKQTFFVKLKLENEGGGSNSKKSDFFAAKLKQRKERTSSKPSWAFVTSYFCFQYYDKGAFIDVCVLTND